MNGIIGMISLLMDTPLDEKQRDYVWKISKSSQNLLAILNDILDYSRVEAGKMELEFQTLNVHDLCEEVVSLFASNARDKKLGLSYEIDPDVPPFVVIDPTRLQQVLNNLVNNAVKFTKEGGIRIHVRVRFPRGKDLQHGQPFDLEFKVTDTGIGIPQTKQESIFDAFQQVDSSVSRRFGGTGLGLAISKRLVELMQGQIRVHSVEGEGSEFSFFVRTRVDREAEQNQEKLKAKDFSFNSTLGERFPLNILVAEDNMINQTVIEGILEKMGFAVTLVEDGQEALDALKVKSYDLIFMDIQMPDMDGLTATRHILNSYSPHRRPFIIAMTANAMSGVREQYLSAGMDDYISKPFKLQDLEAVIIKWGQKVLNRRVHR